MQEPPATTRSCPAGEAGGHKIHATRSQGPAKPGRGTASGSALMCVIFVLLLHPAPRQRVQAVAPAAPHSVARSVVSRLRRDRRDSGRHNCAYLGHLARSGSRHTRRNNPPHGSHLTARRRLEPVAGHGLFHEPKFLKHSPCSRREKFEKSISKTISRLDSPPEWQYTLKSLYADKGMSDRNPETPRNHKYRMPQHSLSMNEIAACMRMIEKFRTKSFADGPCRNIDGNNHSCSHQWFTADRRSTRPPPVCPEVGRQRPNA